MAIVYINKKRSITFALFAFLVSIAFVSCNNKSEQQSQAQPVEVPVADVPVVYPKDSFETGKVIPSIPLAGYPAESFALYLPKGYTDTARYPVMVFLDIYGQGSLPLDMYKALADKYSYILVGSNNFSKKFSTPEATAVANRLVKEVSERFKIDEKRLTLCGYGNGAKGRY